MIINSTPKANFIQIGLQDIIQVIEKTSATEGDFLELSEETIQQPNIKFLDLFWFFNPDKVIGNKNEQKLDLITFGINLNYGNLRINGYLDVKEALHNQALFITKDLLTVNASIYPSGLFHIRHMQNGGSFRPLEQLFIQYDPQKEPWHNELARTFFQKQNDMMKMGISRGDKNYFYIFKNQQYDLFNFALDYILNNGFNLVGARK